jgi:hypothetical protein
MEVYHCLKNFIHKFLIPYKFLPLLKHSKTKVQITIYLNHGIGPLGVEPM